MAGDTWAGDTLAGDTWAGDTLAGDTWAGDTWAGDTLAGDTWAGDTCAGDTWAGFFNCRTVFLVYHKLFSSTFLCSSLPYLKIYANNLSF